jgi:hypothetical protein
MSIGEWRQGGSPGIPFLEDWRVDHGGGLIPVSDIHPGVRRVKGHGRSGAASKASECRRAATSIRYSKVDWLESFPKFAGSGYGAVEEVVQTIVPQFWRLIDEEIFLLLLLLFLTWLNHVGTNSYGVLSPLYIIFFIRKFLYCSFDSYRTSRCP